MKDQDKTKEQLVSEVEDLRQRVAALEGIDAERKQAEEALRQSEGRYRALAESTRDIIFVLDRQGTLLYANQAASQCIGIPAGDIVGKRQADLFPPEMARSQIEKTGRVVATGEVIEYDDLFHFGPVEVWLQIHLIPIRDETGQITSVMGVCHNITQRKRAEQALRDREAQLLEAQEIANLGFYVWEIATGRIATSPILDRIFGIPLDYERTIDQWGDHIHPDDRQGLLGYLTKVVAEKEPFDREYRIIRHGDNQVRWVHGRGRLKFNEDGQPTSILGTVQDITERKQAEQELAKNKAVLQAAIDCLPFNFFAIGRDGRYMLQNAVSKENQQADVIGKRPEDICSNKRDLAIWLDNNRRAFAGEKVEGEVTLSLVDEERNYYNVIVPIRNGEELHGILGVNIDITERKRAETALQKAHDELEQQVKETRLNEARLEAVLHLSHMTEASQKEITDFALEQAVALTESKIGYVAFMNEDETLLTMHSWSKEAMAECAISDKPLAYPVETTGLWGEAARQRKPIVTNDYPAPNPLKKGIPEGHIGLRRHMNAPIIDEGRIVIVAGVGNKEADYNESDVRQLTLLMTGMWTLIQRNRIQAELRQHRDHLEQLVHERTQSLWRMLHASDHERQIISYEIHDGLAQYLAAAGMQFQAYDSLKENSPVEAKKAYDIAVGLVRQAHAESRRLISEVRPPIIDENGLEMAISHLVHEQRRHGGPTIECHSNVQFKRLPSVLENALYRIAQEALTNACKHSKSKKVTVTMTQEDQEVRLEVRDWGIGFDAGVVKEGHFGVEGIRQRVRLLGGRLSIESKPDSGTLIQVVVPLLETQAEE